jgi:hypothetical protein
MAKTTTKKAEKATEEKVDAKVDYSKFDYRPGDLLEVQAGAIAQIRQSIQHAIQQGIKQTFPTVTKWIAVASNVEVEKPTAQAIQSGQVRPILDLQKTFSQDNLKVDYEDWVAPLVQALDKFNEIHIHNVDNGRATEQAVLIEEAKKAQEAADKAKAAE